MLSENMKEEIGSVEKQNDSSTP